MTSTSGLSEFNRAEVRGHTQVFRPAPLGLRLVALLTDLGVLALIAAVALRAGDLPPYLDADWIAPIVALFLVAQSAQLALFSATWGARIWGLRRLDPKTREKPSRPSRWLASRLILRDTTATSEALRPLGLMTLTLAAGLGGLLWITRDHPAWRSADSVRLEGAIPDASEAANWIVAPFYYASGAWPKVFGGQPVLYSLPYEKGPPKQFVGHIVARWEMPETRLVFSGPATPEGRPKPASVSECLREGWLSRAGRCVPIREASLRKHLEEMSVVKPRAWRLAWFEVDTPPIPAEERARGIRIEALGSHRAQLRYVLINARGTQQSLTLEYVPGQRGDQARELFERAIKSLRVGEEIFSGRAYADREIARVRIDTLSKSTGSADFLHRLSTIQALLLAKLSVDPRSYDAFFHLGGTAVLLSRFARKNNDPELSAAARPLLANALRYATDLSPHDPRTAQLSTLLLEVQGN